MARDGEGFENHPAAAQPGPKFTKGEYVGIGEEAPLKDTTFSPNAKTGEPFGKGGE